MIKQYSKITNLTTLFLATLTGATILSYISSTITQASAATSHVDEITITVPVSCTLTGTVDTPHTADAVYNGTLASDIGTTTLKTFCNDNNGFAIYATGYTGDTIGEEDSNKLVSTTAGIASIPTGLATGGENSAWAMKLTKTLDTNDTTNNPFTIDSAPNVENGTPASFSEYHTVPNTYTKVAHKTAATDMNTTTGGAALQTTYRAYISPTQAAGTYQGKVIYTLVHPSDAAAPAIPGSFDAVYADAGKTKMNGYYRIQDLTGTMCADVTTGQTTTLIDVRDSVTYMVGKLADDNCWMLDNLALDPTDSTTAQNMDATNTNATAEAITNYLNGGNTNNNAGWSSTAVADVDTGFNSYTAPMINNASKDTLVTSYGPASTNGQAKVGIYYNYCAATVGTYCYGAGQGVDAPNTNIDAEYDICPANWRMPTGGSTGGYLALYNKYNTTTNATDVASLQYNLSTPLSGYFDSSSANYQNEWSYWWSSSYGGGSRMLDLYVGPTYVSPYSYGGRYAGYSMRCLVGE